MEIAIPTALKSLASAGSAISELTAWRKRARGDARAIVEDGVPLGDVIRKISNQEYKRLAKAGYDFGGLKKGRIRSYSSLKGTELDSWSGKSTEDLVESIYDKIGQLIIRYPHVSNNKNYRWTVRVNNIRKRIWLLLRHVQE